MELPNVINLLNAMGFETELGGGGCTFLSLYLANGAYLWVTCSQGCGMPTATDWLVGAYPTGWDGEELDFIVYSEDSLLDVITVANLALKSIM